MNVLLVIISFSVLILVHELGHFLSAKLFGVKVEKFGIGFPPRILWKKVRETEYSVNLLPFGGFVKIYGEHGEEVSANNRERAFVSQPAWKKSVMILSGVLMNIIAGWIVMIAVFSVGAPQHVLITEVADHSPAEKAGLKSGDIADEATFGAIRVPAPLTSDQISAEARAHGGESAELVIQRDGKILKISVPLRANPPAGEGAMGVSLVDIGFAAFPFPQNIIEGTKAVFESLKLIIAGFYSLAAGLFHEPDILKAVSGPVGIVSVASRAGTIGLIYLAQFMALISLNLAVLNLIPFPALDGGQFVMVLIEKIRGRLFSARVKIIVNSIGMGLLLFLMILVTVKDLGNIFR